MKKLEEKIKAVSSVVSLLFEISYLEDGEKINEKDVVTILSDLCKKSDVNDEVSLLDLRKMLTQKFIETNVNLSKIKNVTEDDIDVLSGDLQREKVALLIDLIVEFKLLSRRNELLRFLENNHEVSLLLDLNIEYLVASKAVNYQGYDFYEILDSIQNCRMKNFEENEVHKLKELLSLMSENSDKNFNNITEVFIRNNVQNKFWNILDFTDKKIEKLINDEDQENIKMIRIGTEDILHYVLKDLNYEKDSKRHIDNIKPELSKMCNFISRKLKKENLKMTFIKESNKNYEILLSVPMNDNKEKNFKLLMDFLNEMLSVMHILISNKNSIFVRDKVLIDEKELLNKVWDKVRLEMMLEKKEKVKTNVQKV